MESPGYSCTSAACSAQRGRPRLQRTNVPAGLAEGQVLGGRLDLRGLCLDMENKEECRGLWKADAHMLLGRYGPRSRDPGKSSPLQLCSWHVAVFLVEVIPSLKSGAREDMLRLPLRAVPVAVT